MSKIDAILELAKQGLNANAIATQLNIHPTHARRIARKHGNPLKRPPSDKMIDVSGQTFGHLTAISRPVGKNNQWICRCLCGGEKIVPTSALRAGTVISCGCRYQTGDQSRTHSMSKAPEYKIWHSMKQRCSNPRTRHFSRYGGRGIVVCDQWQKSFESFYADMGPRPQGCSIERIDNDGNYEPENCRWASQIEQNNNTKRNVKITFRGERITVAQLRRNFAPEISIHTLRSRLKRGWDVEIAISAAPQPGRAL